MPKQPSDTVPWFRRPRRGLPRSWLRGMPWFMGFFLSGVLVIAGLGVVAGGPGGWANAVGLLLALLGGAVGVWLAAYLLRPVARPDPRAEMADLLAAADAWERSFNRQGHVEAHLSKRRVARAFVALVFVLLMACACIFISPDPFGLVIGVAGILLFVFLAALPNLEWATSGRPALLVDARGIQIGRWGGLEIPWSRVVAVRGHKTQKPFSTKPLVNVIVQVDETFFNEYQAARRWPLRIADTSMRHVGLEHGFTVPSTIVADPESLALWLKREAERRQR